MSTSLTGRSRGRDWVGSRRRGAVGIAGAAVVGVALLAVAFFPGPPGCAGPTATATVMPRIHSVGSHLYAGSSLWRAWGFNWGIGDHSPVVTYFDHPTSANLAVLACELNTAQRLGANSMRVYIELQHVMQGPNRVRPSALAALRGLLNLAARDGVYLDITGDLVWRPQRIAGWYDRLSEPARWQVQANFWRAVARTAHSSAAVLCYELTSEPSMSDAPGWYFGQFGGWWFGQIVAHPNGRDQRQLARAWTKLLASAVRSQDNRPITIGLLPVIGGGFAPGNVAGLLDMLVVHDYAQTGQAAQAVAVVRHFASFGKPVLLGETYPLVSDFATQQAFLIGASRYLAGVFEFFDGRDPDHIAVKTINDAVQRQALRQFVSLRQTILHPR